MVELPLVLGGHTYIQQLGNDPQPSEQAIDDIVQSCLAAGIDWFDTTYRPERIALGASLSRLGMVSKAHILAWNFFKLFGPGEDVGRPDYYRPEHIRLILEDLGQPCIDGLVVHPLDDLQENHRQERLALAWQEQGLVRSLGIWSPGKSALREYPDGKPYSFVVEPHNVTTAHSLENILAYLELGWMVFACSPFVRGWALDQLVERSTGLGYESISEGKRRLANLMLRYSLFTPGVHRLIVSMRRPEWVAEAVSACAMGELSPAERVILDELR